MPFSKDSSLLPVAVQEADVAIRPTDLDEIGRRIGRRFVRQEPRQRALAYLKGLLYPIERKNSWQIAEALGDRVPYGIQHLLDRARWDADLVRDDLRGYVIDHLADQQAVLVVDETGFIKKGNHSAGVQRQYSGTAGRIENCQLGVFLSYATSSGYTFIDRELYLPKSWLEDPDRCQAAGIPETVSFATKPQLARRMLQRALEAGVPAAWVTGDEVYSNYALRQWLEGRRQAYLLAVSNQQTVHLDLNSCRVSSLAKKWPLEAWQKISAGDGSKGPRWYDWAWIPLNSPLPPEFGRWLLIRRSRGKTVEYAYYLVFGPAQTTLAKAVVVAGRRWTIESGFETAKGQVGLDHYEVRKWDGWYRHITLTLFAQALLTVLRAQCLEAELKKQHTDGL